MSFVDEAEQARERLNTGVKAVEDRHRFDEARLAAWMAANVEGFEGPLAVRQFKGGQSNPTFQLVTPAKTYVMRRKPPGPLLPSAHAVDREHRVIAALWPTGFPVPRPYGLCRDEEVIGVMFYVMEMVEGRVLWDHSLPQYAPAERHAIYMAKIRTLARLHNTDVAAVGLSDFGRPGNYFARQISRWSQQYRASETETVPELERLIEWLPATTPDDDRTSIVHGDYRMDNMVLHPTEPQVRAVLDWELSTLGNPLADFTYLLMNWIVGPVGALPDLAAHGIPTIEEAVAEYVRLTGRESLPALDWYMTYNFFRSACIAQGILGRVRDGTAASPQAADMAKKRKTVTDAAWKYAQRAGI